LATADEAGFDLGNTPLNIKSLSVNYFDHDIVAFLLFINK